MFGRVVDVGLKVPEDRVQDLLDCALESGGSNYWAEVVSRVGDPFHNGHIAFKAYDDNAPYAHAGETEFCLDAGAIQSGLRAMLAGSPSWFCQFLEENEDGPCGDVFLQYCLFGEIVFG